MPQTSSYKCSNRDADVVVKYELDSLCSFMKLSRSYYQATNDTSFMNDECTSVNVPTCARQVDSCCTCLTGVTSIGQIMRVVWEQSQATFDENWDLVSYYNWTSEAGSLAGAVNNGGNGEPKAYTGLIGTHHRPSDDLSTFGECRGSFRTGLGAECARTIAFLTPANAMLTVELGYLADILDDAGLASDVSQAAREYKANITDAIWNHTVSL